MRVLSVSSIHVPGLDGVRGLAILLVLFIHLGVMIPETRLERIVFTGMSMGWIGVELFFVLSGMLITGILLDTRQDAHHFRNFYVRRVLRIFPLYYALLIFSFYILPHFPHPKLANFSRVDGDEIWYWLFLSNFNMAAAGGPRHGIMDVTWSLAIEEQFYVVWPLGVYLLGLKRLAVLCLALIATSITLRLAMHFLGYPAITLYVLTPLRLDGLCVGALVAVVLRWPGLTRCGLMRIASATLVSGGLATACVMLVSSGLPWDGAVVQTAGFATLALMFGGVVMRTVLNAGTESILDRVMRWPFLKTLGVLSFALYLLHLPLRAVLRDTIMKPELFATFPGGTLVAQLVFYIAAGGLAVVAAWASYHLFEKRFLRFKEYFAPAETGIEIVAMGREAVIGLPQPDEIALVKGRR
jgi:peptidoglycan/LPS O-acetylase OafA/YrhL